MIHISNIHFVRLRSKIIEKYRDKRTKESEEVTRIDTIFNNIKKLMESMKWFIEQDKNAMQISDSDKAILVKLF